MTLTNGGPGDSTQVVKDVARLKEALKNTPDRGAAEIERYLQAQGAMPVDEAPKAHAPPSDEALRAALATGQQKTEEGLSGLAHTYTNSALLGVPAAVSPGFKKHVDEFQTAHPVVAGVTSVTAPFSLGGRLPNAFSATRKARALVGGTAGAIAAATPEGTPDERFHRAIFGGGLGALLGSTAPAVGQKLTKKVTKIVQPYANKIREIADANAPLLPADAEARVARLEQLAPGTGTPMSTTAKLWKSARGIGAAPTLAMQEEAAATGRLGKLQTALDNMKPKYDALLANKRAPMTVRNGPNITPIMVKHGHIPQADVGLERVQLLRGTLRAKREALFQRAEKGKGGGQQAHELKEDYNTLTRWLEYHAPGITNLDTDYGILSRAKRGEQALIQKHIVPSQSGYASTRSVGLVNGSPAMAVPSAKGVINAAIAPDREDFAAAMAKMLLQPGRIPKEMLQARARAMRGPSKGLLDAFSIGAQAHPLTGLLAQADSTSLLQ